MKLFVLGSFVHAHCLSVDRLPLPGESITATGLCSEYGGKGLNLAVAIHRMDVTVETLMAVGEDAAADGLIAFMQEYGMRTGGITRTGLQSGYGVGFIDANGTNFLAVYPGANSRLSGAHVLDALPELSSADMVCAQFEIPDDPILTAFRHARGLGIRTLLNPSPWRTLNRELLELTDILIVNETEAASLFQQPLDRQLSLEHWQDLLQDYNGQDKLVVITLADQGCIARHQGKTFYQPAWPVNAVDATGAGDAFSAGLTVALAQGKSVQEALKIACACGAWVVARLGVLQALPTAMQISRFMEDSL